MGIVVEFNPELALRKAETLGKIKEECIPENLSEGETYYFLKEGQRNYWLNGEIALCETKGDGIVSKPLGYIKIIEETHFMNKDKVFTKGKYILTKRGNR